MTKQEFIENIARYVIKYASQFGIKVHSPIIAQACLESAYGTSKKAQYHNYFGLKYRPDRITCNSGYFQDGGSEQRADGSYAPINTDWYAFENVEKGVLGYFQFINTVNYASLKGVTDPYQYLVNIKACGYASSINYVKKVWNVIQTNGLTRYDDMAEKAKFKVAVDAGHGSNTAGKRTPDGYREHWINVCTASFCEQALIRCGIDVLRVAWDDNNAKDDEDVALSTRQKLIKANKCNVSVSFHANAYGNDWNNAQGVETLISDKAPGDSRTLANIVQSYLVQGTPQKNRGVKTQSLAMCNCTSLGVKAAILCEIGFMTNKAEADLMKTDRFCKEQAEEAAHGICDYLGVKYITSGGSVVSDIIEQAKNTPVGYLVKINTDVLNVRSGAGTSYPVVTQVKRGQIYTIVDEVNGWGKLKSGAGYIKLSYTTKI